MQYVEMTKEGVNEIVRNQKEYPVINKASIINGRVAEFKGIAVKVISNK